MTEPSYDLAKYSQVLKVHPRTVLRYLTEEHNTYWVEGYEKEIPLNEVADAFGITPRILTKVINQRDEFLTKKEALKVIDIKEKTFEYRRYKSDLKMSSVVRYLYSNLIDQHMHYM